MADPTYTPDFGAIKDGFQAVEVFGLEWVIPIIMATIMVALITRDVEKWKILYFPVFVLLAIMSVPVHFLLLIVSGVYFVIETLSLQTIGRILQIKPQWTSKEEAALQKAHKNLEIAQRKEDRQKAIKEGRLKGLIPFSRGTTIGEVLRLRKNPKSTEQIQAEAYRKYVGSHGLTINESDILKSKEYKKLKEESIRSVPPKTAFKNKIPKWRHKGSEAYWELRNAGKEHKEAYKDVGDSARKKGWIIDK